MFHEYIYAVNVKVSSHNAAFLVEWPSTPSPYGPSPGLALTESEYNQNWRIWTLPAPTSRKDFALKVPLIFHKSVLLNPSLLPAYVLNHYVLLFYFLIVLKGKMLFIDSSLLLQRLPGSFPRAIPAFQQAFVFLSPADNLLRSFYLHSILFIFFFFFPCYFKSFPSYNDSSQTICHLYILPLWLLLIQMRINATNEFWKEVTLDECGMSKRRSH